jgi:hypothetical protein
MLGQLLLMCFWVNTFELCGLKQGYQATGFPRSGLWFCLVVFFFVNRKTANQPTDVPWFSLSCIVPFTLRLLNHATRNKKIVLFTLDTIFPMNFISQHILACRSCILESVLRIRIRDPESSAFLTPGSGIRNRFFPDPGSRIPDLGSRIPDPKPILLRV